MKRVFFTFLSIILCGAIYAQIPAGYYDNANGKVGEALKSALNDIIDGHTELSYSECWDALKVTDRDPANSNNVIGIYSRFSMDADAQYANGAGWNREHVWAKSRGDFGTSPGAGTDIHHLRACDVSTNSARSNKSFDDGGTTYVDASGNYSGTTPVMRDSDSWEPGDDQKGDIARMMFYMATRYEGENGEPDLELTESIPGTSDKEPFHGRLSALLAWHEADPVDQEEMDRHEGIFSFQGNRNPFIDHPEWVDDIWGDGSNVTAAIQLSNNSGLSFGTVAAGESSSSQSYTVSGSDLEGNISVSVSSPFELSSDDSNWSQSLTITQAVAESGGQTVYVRFSPTIQNSQSYNQNITHSSTGASNVTLNVSGTENTDIPDPTILISESFFDFGDVTEGTSSSSQSYSVSGTDLEGDISVSVSSPFEISVNNSSWTQSLSVSQATAESGGQTVYVRFSPSSASNQSYNQNITHTSSGASAVTLGVIGTEVMITPDPTILLSRSSMDFGEASAGASSNSQSYSVSGTNLDGDVSVSVPTPFELSTNNSNWAQSLTVTQAIAESGGQTIFVRFSPTVQNGQSFNQTISHSSANATNKTLAVSGQEFTELPDPEISVSKTSIDFGEVAFGETAEESYTLFALNLVDDVSVTPPDELILSLSSDFNTIYTSSSPLILNQTGGEIGQTTIYVRYTPPVDDGSFFDEYILHSTSGADEDINVTGKEFAEPIVPNGWISEFHYANSGADQNEFIEFYLKESENYNLSDFTIELVENDGSVYSSFLASSMTEGTEGYYSRNFGGIKDGPNGIRVSYELEVIHAISYGGAITGFELIDVEEGETSSSQTSIQLCCGSNNYEDMEWTAGAIATPGAPNQSITLSLEENLFYVYPNPTRGEITLEGFTGNISISLFDFTGRLILRSEGEKNEIEKLLSAELSKLNAGTYFLDIVNEQVVNSIKLIIED